MVSGRQGDERAQRRRSGSAWWAAGRAPSSAACIASPRARRSTTSWSPARCRSDPARTPRPRAELGIAPDRTYGRLRGDGEGRGGTRPTASRSVSIVTPNHVHYPGRHGLPRGRHPRHLRQAADDVARGRRGRCETLGRARAATSSC